jgi:cytochrome c-type biogenesis protein CcmH/NrfG
VGLTTFYLKGGQGLNFALPAEDLMELAAGKKPRPPARAAPKTPPGPAASGDWENQAAAPGKSQDWHGLLAHCRRWTQAQPDNTLAYYYLGFVYHVLGRHREAVEAYREAVRLKPDDAEAWYNLGVSYGNLGRHREAAEAYREAVRCKPDDAEVWGELNEGYFISGNRIAALEAVKELRRYDSQKADELFNLIMKP